MSKYSGKPALVERPAEELFSRFSDLKFLEEKINDLPQEAKAKIGELRFEPDCIVICTAQVGEIKFKVKERVEPVKVVFTAENAPVPIDMTVNFNAKTPESTEVVTEIDVDIPVILRPMVGPHLQKAADMFGEMMSSLTF